MKLSSKKERRIFIRNLFISFGIIYLCGWARVSIILFLGDIFVYGKSFSSGNVFEVSWMITCHSLPNIVFYIFLGIFIPYLIINFNIKWIWFIGVLLISFIILKRTIHWVEPPDVVDYLRAWIPTLLIIPSLILGTLLTQKYKLIKYKESP